MIRFRMCENYIQYVDGIEENVINKIKTDRNVYGWKYYLHKVRCPELIIREDYRIIELFLPGCEKNKDYTKLYFKENHRDLIYDFFDTFKDILQLEGVDRWIL